MPISHVCQGCGEDLADLRPGLDPHYGLRVIVCPHCRAASVRTRDPMVAGWRYARRLVAAAVLAVMHAAVLLPVIVGMIVLGVGEAGRVLDPLHYARVGEEIAVARWAFVALAAAAGWWLGVAMPHRGPFERAGVWLGLLTVPVAVMAAVVLLSAPWRIDHGSDVVETPKFYLGLWGLAAASCIPVLAAEPLVRLTRFILAAFTAGVFRWRRNNARKLRSGH